MDASVEAEDSEPELHIEGIHFNPNNTGLLCPKEPPTGPGIKVIWQDQSRLDPRFGFSPRSIDRSESQPSVEDIPTENIFRGSIRLRPHGGDKGDAPVADSGSQPPAVTREQ